MNDFDDIIGVAVGARAERAPRDRPDFGEVLEARQQRLRRRSVVGAVGVLAIGVTGMAAFAVGGPPESTADGPVGPDGPFATTTFAPAVPVPGESIWYCEGALDPYSTAPTFPTTTTMTPQTTVALPDQPDLVAPVEASTIPDVAYRPPMEDSGFFRSCVLVGDDSVTELVEADPFLATTTISTMILSSGEPVTTDSDGVVVPEPAVTSVSDSQTYVVQNGDYAIKIAELFGVPVEALIEANGWAGANEFPFPGDTILIPPGAAPAPTTTTTSLLDE